MGLCSADHILWGLELTMCSLLGCWLADPLNNRLGRRGAIFFAGNFLIWPVIGSAFCRTWPQQMVCRLLMGVGMGAKASTVPIYAAENAPAAIRGALVMSWRLCPFSLAMCSSSNCLQRCGLRSES